MPDTRLIKKVNANSASKLVQTDRVGTLDYRIEEIKRQLESPMEDRLKWAKDVLLELETLIERAVEQN